MSDVLHNKEAWCEGWISPFESPLSLLWKFAWANCLTAGDVCKALFGRNLTQSFNKTLHGRTLLTPTWIPRAMQIPSSKIVSAVASGGLDTYSAHWAAALASDARIRFCPHCAGCGYHTIFAQIDGLHECPIHAQPLLAACAHCGAATPRFALIADTMEAPWRCIACEHPFGGEFRPDSWALTAEEQGKIHVALVPLARWLQTLDQLQLKWPGQQTWQGRWLDVPFEQRKRIATFSVLRAILPIDLPEQQLTQSERRLSVTIGSAVPGIEPGRALLEMPPKEDRGLLSIYKSIRRYLQRCLGRCARREDAMASIEIMGRDQILKLSRKSCARKQALLLWRLRFEDFEQFQAHLRSYHPVLRLRESALHWPWREAANHTAWAAYALASAHASFEVVADWWARAQELNDEDIYGQDRVHALTLYLEFAPFLSPIKTPVLPQVTMLLKAPSQLHHPLSMVVIGPGPRFDDLKPCPRCARQRCDTDAPQAQRPTLPAVHALCPKN